MPAAIPQPALRRDADPSNGKTPDRGPQRPLTEKGIRSSR